MLSTESDLPEAPVGTHELCLAHEQHPQSTQAELETEPEEERQVNDTRGRQEAQEIGSTAESEEIELVERGAPATQEQRNMHSGEQNKLTMRTRRPPKKFTYDNFGTPVCRNVQSMSGDYYQEFRVPNTWTTIPFYYPQAPPFCY